MSAVCKVQESYHISLYLCTMVSLVGLESTTLGDNHTP
jgi:hypothetical protein